MKTKTRPGSSDGRSREESATAEPSLASLSLDIAPQPDDTTCGPTCLHAVYQYYGDKLGLRDLTEQVPSLPGGGALAVTLANHALKRGYRATIYTYNLQLFDPTWFEDKATLRDKLREQAKFKRSQRLRMATEAYLEFLDAGGKIRLGIRPSKLIRDHLKKQVPILTGLSATHLYRCARTHNNEYDSVRGEPEGHFVVLSGYDSASRRVVVSDPLHDNPGFGTHRYDIDAETLSCAIMLGIVTYDANLLIIQPSKKKKKADAHSDRG